MASGEGLQDVEYLSSSQADDRSKALVKQSSDVVLSTHIEPRDDMLEERRRASFNATSLAAYLNGGKEKLQRLCAPLPASEYYKITARYPVHTYVEASLYSSCHTAAGKSSLTCCMHRAGATRAGATTTAGRRHMRMR